METRGKSNVKKVDKIETYDMSVQKAAALLVSKKHSTALDRQALVKSILDDGKEMTDYILAHAPGK